MTALTRKGQISAACEALLPSPLERTEKDVRCAVVRALDKIKREVTEAQRSRPARSKQGKRKLMRLLGSARQVRRLRANYDALEREDKAWLAEIETINFDNQLLDRAIFKAEVLLRPAGQSFIYAGRELGKRPVKRQRRQKDGRATTDLKRAATGKAYELLVWCGHAEPATTREGRWERLTQALVGDDDADVFDHLRAFKKNAPCLATSYPIEQPKTASGQVVPGSPLTTKD